MLPFIHCIKESGDPALLNMENLVMNKPNGSKLSTYIRFVLINFSSSILMSIMNQILLL